MFAYRNISGSVVTNGSGGGGCLSRGLRGLWDGGRLCRGCLVDGGYLAVGGN